MVKRSQGGKKEKNIILGPWVLGSVPSKRREGIGEGHRDLHMPAVCYSLSNQTAHIWLTGVAPSRDALSGAKDHVPTAFPGQTQLRIQPDKLSCSQYFRSLTLSRAFREQRASQTNEWNLSKGQDQQALSHRAVEAQPALPCGRSARPCSLHSQPPPDCRAQTQRNPNQLGKLKRTVSGGGGAHL